MRGRRSAESTHETKVVICKPHMLGVRTMVYRICSISDVCKAAEHVQLCHATEAARMKIACSLMYLFWGFLARDFQEF